MKIHEFAEKAGVTVKTLLYYDKIGLLTPLKNDSTGYRIYNEEDFIKLQQIIILKFIGLSLDEIKMVLTKGGVFYVTTNSNEAMAELNELVKRFDHKLGLHNNGMCDRFDLENGYPLLKKYFSDISLELLEGKIIVDTAEHVVSYKASTIKGNSILVGEKRQEFTRYVEEYIKEKGKLSITTKAGIFKLIK